MVGIAADPALSAFSRRFGPDRVAQNMTKDHHMTRLTLICATALTLLAGSVLVMVTNIFDCEDSDFENLVTIMIATTKTKAMVVTSG